MGLIARHDTDRSKKFDTAVYEWLTKVEKVNGLREEQKLVAHSTEFLKNTGALRVESYRRTSKSYWIIN